MSRSPSARTLQRGLRRADLAPAPAGRPAKGSTPRATLPHDAWQMDAKELIKLNHGDLVSWLRLVDECSGAVLQTVVFPPREMESSPPADVRDQLRRAFARRGLPGSIRVDNGSPWGSKGDFPTELALGLIGLGIGMIWNTPNRPQENGVVERSQGTGDRWCEPGTCAAPAELQTRLDRMDQLHREVYPYRDRLSRLAYYPGLAHSGRPYAPESEADLWDWNRVTTHLSGYVATWQVSRTGMVSIYNRGYYVGRVFQGQEVYVTFDPETNEWVFSDAVGRELRHKTAKEISPECVMALEVTGRT